MSRWRRTTTTTSTRPKKSKLKVKNKNKDKRESHESSKKDKHQALDEPKQVSRDKMEHKIRKRPLPVFAVTQEGNTKAKQDQEHTGGSASSSSLGSGGSRPGWLDPLIGKKRKTRRMGRKTLDMDGKRDGLSSRVAKMTKKRLTLARVAGGIFAEGKSSGRVSRKSRQKMKKEKRRSDKEKAIFKADLEAILIPGDEVTARGKARWSASGRAVRRKDSTSSRSSSSCRTPRVHALESPVFDGGSRPGEDDLIRGLRQLNVSFKSAQYSEKTRREAKGRLDEIFESCRGRRLASTFLQRDPIFLALDGDHHHQQQQQHKSRRSHATEHFTNDVLTSRARSGSLDTSGEPFRKDLAQIRPSSFRMRLCQEDFHFELRQPLLEGTNSTRLF